MNDCSVGVTRVLPVSMMAGIEIDDPGGILAQIEGGVDARTEPASSCPHVEVSCLRCFDLESSRARLDVEYSRVVRERERYRELCEQVREKCGALLEEKRRLRDDLDDLRCRLDEARRQIGELEAVRALDGLGVPGWFCAGERCGAFNGTAKILRAHCRACGLPRPVGGEVESRPTSSVEPATEPRAPSSDAP